MSKKSRQPDGADAKADKADKKAKGKKGKGKKGALPEGAERRLVVETRPPGVPFAIVVLVAAAMSLPSIANYTDGGIGFDALMIRVLGALAVAWLLAQLVYAVFDAMRPPQVSAVVELPAEEAFEAAAERGPLTGTIVGGDDFVAESDTFSLDPIEPAALPEAAAADRDEDAA